MKKILAVSGGVDSMTLFDLMKGEDIIVAHFDHGIRKSSATDAKFVQEICKDSGVKYIIGRGYLDPAASEAIAREARYNFLNKVAKEYNGKIYTAHHLDDMVESAAINILRGTGWRGLAPMGSKNIKRPFLEKGWRRQDILRYAGAHQLRFRQDPTNTEPTYLRNRVRAKLAEKTGGEVEKLIEYCRNQAELRVEIDEIIARLLPKDGNYQRAWFKNLPDAVAMEILRAAASSAGVKMTRPQLSDFLNAVRTFAPEKEFNLPGGKLVKIHKTYYNISNGQ